MLNLMRKVVKGKTRKFDKSKFEDLDESKGDLGRSKTAIRASQLGLLREDEESLVNGWCPSVRTSTKEYKEYLKETFNGFDHHKCPSCFQKECLQQIAYKREKTLYFCHKCNEKIYLYTFYFEPPVPGWTMDMHYEVYFFFKEN